MGNDTTGAAECNFGVLKSRKTSSAINDKSSLRTLADRLQEQERLRIVNICEGRDREFSMLPVMAAGVPSDLLGSWTREGLALVSREAERAGLGGTAKYRVWSVCPQVDSKAKAAWVVQRQGLREDGGTHRIRVIHAIEGRMHCTCWTWEVWSIECRHCLSIHGSVAATSASPYWRQGTANGVNDAIIKQDLGKRKLGPKARSPNLHSISVDLEPAPRWAVRFCSRHVELVNSEDAEPGRVLPISSQLTDDSERIGNSKRSDNSNYELGQACRALFDEVVAMVSGPGTTAETASTILAKAKVIHEDTVALVTDKAMTSQGEHLDAIVTTQMRPTRQGRGSSRRSKGPYEATR